MKCHNVLAVTLFSFQIALAQPQCFKICHGTINIPNLKNRINAINCKGILTLYYSDSTFQLVYYNHVGTHLLEQYYSLKGTISFSNHRERLLLIDSISFNEYIQTGLSSVLNEIPQTLSTKTKSSIKIKISHNHVRLKGVRIYNRNRTLKPIFFKKFECDE